MRLRKILKFTGLTRPVTRVLQAEQWLGKGDSPAGLDICMQVI